jgi:photosystem II stability/assembly factor-like uncharacterized protein
VPVTVRPRSNLTEDDRDLAQRVADLEALIEEARRRARRRRRFYAAAVLAAAAVAAALAGVGGIGHGSAGGSRPEGGIGPAAQPGPGRWRPSHGPDGGGFTLTVDPSNPDVLYAGGFGNVFRSSDGGASWKTGSPAPWTRVSALTVDPAHPRVVWAGTNRGIAKSIDRGVRWRMVNRGLFEGETRPERGRRIGEGFVSSIVVDARDPQTVYAATDRGLFRTTTGGDHWRTLGPSLLRNRTCCRYRYGYERTAAFGAGGVIYASWWRAGAASILYVSTDRGDSWRRVEPQGSLQPYRFQALAIDGSGTLYATEGRQFGSTRLPGVIKSSDGGRTWVPAGLPKQEVWQLQVDAGNGSTLYANTTTELLESSDGGATWNAVGNGPNRPTYSAVSDPHDSNTHYGIADGVVKSSDGGHTWAAADNGLVATVITSLALAPGSAATLYAGANGVSKSVDGGRTWRPSGNGLGGVQVLGLIADPRNPATLYAGTERGLFKTSDGGGSWRAVASGLPAHVWSFALGLDPAHPRTVYVAGCAGSCRRPGGFRKTEDGGATWRAVTGVPWPVRSLALDPQHSGIVFAGTTRGGIFRSSDGSRTWRRVAMAPGVPVRIAHRSNSYAVAAIAIDPRDSDNVYAAGITGGIIRSSDGGTTWATANTGLTDKAIVALAIDPRDPRVLYASAGGQWTVEPARVFRSTDGARTWHSFSAGLPAVGVTAFAVDASGRSVFAGTDGGGVIALRRGR